MLFKRSVDRLRLQTNLYISFCQIDSREKRPMRKTASLAQDIRIDIMIGSPFTKCLKSSECIFWRADLILVHQTVKPVIILCPSTPRIMGDRPCQSNLPSQSSDHRARGIADRVSRILRKCERNPEEHCCFR
jgi:hypothetical protein